MPEKKTPLRSLLSGHEITALTPEENTRFLHWIDVNGITDLDHPDSHYDYRGYWKATGGAPVEPGMFISHGDGRQLPRRAHFTDRFKQHGHPTFSQESQYAKPGEGGMWVGDTLVPQPPMAVSHGLDEDRAAEALEIQKNIDRQLEQLRRERRARVVKEAD